MASNDPQLLSLHPLCLLEMSDHYNRVRSCTQGVADGDDEILIGGLLGRSNSIIHSFEIIRLSSDSTSPPDLSIALSKLQQFKIIYSNLEFLGIYHISKNTTTTNHAQLTQLHQSILDLSNHLYNKLTQYYLVTFDLSIAEIPINTYTLDNDGTVKPCLYKIQAAPSEKAALNSIASTESILKNNKVKKSEQDFFNTQIDLLKDNLSTLKASFNKLINYLLAQQQQQKQALPEAQTEVTDDVLLMQIDKFNLQLAILHKKAALCEKEADKQELKYLMTATANLLLLLDHK